MKKLEILFLACFALFVIVIFITPVGGWHESNPHHEDYKFMFEWSGIFLLTSMFLLWIDNKKETK